MPHRKQSPTIDAMVQHMRREHLEETTIEAYVGAVWAFYEWAKENVGRRGKYVNPHYMGRPEVESFLTAEARRGVSASTQNLKFAAVAYLYKHVIGSPLQDVKALRAKTPKLHPVAISREDAMRVLSCLAGLDLLIACLELGAGLRPGEPARLRVSNVNVSNRTIHIRHSKHHKDRITILPECMVDVMSRHVEGRRRWHRHADTFAKALSKAVGESGVTCRVTPNILRHTFAVESLRGGVLLSELMDLMGHKNMNTTAIYMRQDPRMVERHRSPLDSMAHELHKATLRRGPRRLRDAG